MTGKTTEKWKEGEKHVFKRELRTEALRLRNRNGLWGAWGQAIQTAERRVCEGRPGAFPALTEASTPANCPSAA